MNPNIQMILGIFLIAISAVGGFLGTTMVKNGIEEKIIFKEKERLKPNLTVKLFPFPQVVKNPNGSETQLPTRYKYPLQEYILTINSANQDSASAFDFRIDFFFRSIISEIIQQSIMSGGEGAMISGLRIYREKDNVSPKLYEEPAVDTVAGKNFSLTIQKAKIDDKITNTNSVIFDCTRWPKETTGFSARIIVDLSKKQSFVKTPNKLGTYEGTYFYEIKGRPYKERIKGTIPEPSIK